MTDKRVPILNSSVVPTLGADSHFYLYGNGEIISLVPAWAGITVDDIYAFVDELPEGKAVDAIYVPFLHEQTDEEDDDEPHVDLIMLDATFTDRGVYEEYIKHVLADSGGDFEGDSSPISFFVLETSYAVFRAELEAREGISEVVALGEDVGIPSGEITQAMRDATRRLFSKNLTQQVIGRPADNERHPDEDPKAETAPPVPNPMTVEYCVEVLAEGYTREQVESWVKEQGLDAVAVLAAHTAELRYKSERHPDEALFEIDEEPVSELVEAFERQFSQEEAEAVVAGFDGDVKRASHLYKHLTEGYVSSMTVEDLIKAGKG